MTRNAAGHVPTFPKLTFGPNAHNYVCFIDRAEGQKFENKITQKTQSNLFHHKNKSSNYSIIVMYLPLLW